MQDRSETISYDTQSRQIQPAIFLTRSFLSFSFEMYTTPKVLYTLELMRASFASDKPSHVTKVTSVSFSKFELSNNYQSGIYI